MLCFFFKQKTAYEMRISDWSSDVCASDLRARVRPRPRNERDRRSDRRDRAPPSTGETLLAPPGARHGPALLVPAPRLVAAHHRADVLAEIGRASCRERVGQYV